MLQDQVLTLMNILWTVNHMIKKLSQLINIIMDKLLVNILQILEGHIINLGPF